MKKLFLFLLFPILLQSCYNNSATGGSSSRSTISGAGATFPYPYYNIVFRDFMRPMKIKPLIMVQLAVVEV